MLYSLIFIVFAALLGLMLLFSGYRFFRILLPLWALFTGLFAGMSGMNALLGESLFASAMGFLVGIVIGLIFAALAYYAYALAVIIYGVTLGYALGAGLMYALGFESMMPFIVGIISAGLFGVLFVSTKMPRVIIMVTSALAGAMALIMALFVLLGPMTAVSATLGLTSLKVTNSLFWTLGWIVLSAVGIAVQHTMEKDMDMMSAYMWEDEMKKVSTTAPAEPQTPTQ